MNNENIRISSNVCSLITSYIITVICVHISHLLKCIQYVNTPLLSTDTNLTIPPFQVRLVGGTTEYEGRVEVRYHGIWGTVCDDYWDLNDASVVCRELGYEGAESALTGAYFGQGSGAIWLDNLFCTGTEDSIANCSSSGFGIHSCGHYEDAGVVCIRKSKCIICQIA